MRRLLHRVIVVALVVLSAQTLYAALSDNLLVYFSLSDATDDHGSNDLTETSGTIPFVSGLVGNAADFEEGDTEYFTRADTADLSAGDTNFTFAAWVNAESLSSFHVILNKGWSGSAGAREYILYRDVSAGDWVWFVEDSSNNTNSETINVGASTATWYFVVVWHNATGNEIGMDINASGAQTTAHTTGVRDSAGAFELGASSSQTLYWDGLIDEVGMWRRVLTSDERTELYNSGAGRNYAYVSGGGGGAVVPKLTLLGVGEWH